MKVKVTQSMKKYISGVLNKYKVELIKLTPDQYSMFVDYDLFDHETDYSIKTGLFSVLKIIYPCEYYANPLYLTTKDLIRIFSGSDKTATGFNKALVDYCEI